MTTGRHDKRRLAALPVAAERSARDRPWGGHDRQQENHESERSCHNEAGCSGREALPKPRTQVAGATKLRVTQDLVEILELNATVLLHGFTPEMIR
ncbi:MULTISPECIES: hypothetical protein [Bradyrhizobium]|uniref:hypothetical protein n=1 Tax=Bradyrhizobium TaxID=374 RepID=UPI0011AE7D84|nr:MULTISPECIES: hypothetical protein [Bradyrhizobium]